MIKKIPEVGLPKHISEDDTVKAILLYQTAVIQLSHI